MRPAIGGSGLRCVWSGIFYVAGLAFGVEVREFDQEALRRSDLRWVSGFRFLILGVRSRIQGAVRTPGSRWSHPAPGPTMLRLSPGLRKDAGLCCGSRLLEGRSVCLCWAPSKPKGPKGWGGAEVDCLREVCAVRKVS